MGIVSQRLRDSARGQPCTLNFPGCNHNPETTVLAHLPSQVKGLGTKSDDWHAVFACSSCHDALDLRKPADTYWFAVNALQRTQKIWFETGLLSIPVTEQKPRKPSSKIVPRVHMYMPGISPEDCD